MGTISSQISPALAETRLRELARFAAAADVGSSDDRLQRTAVDAIRMVLGEPCTVRLTGVGGSDATGVSSHSDAVRAELDRAGLTSFVPPDATETVVSSADPAGAWLHGHGLRQYATFPVAGSGRTVGVLVVTRAANRPALTGEDLAFAAATAAILGAVLVDRQVLAHATAVVDELQAQAEVVNQISDALITCDDHLRVLSWNAAAENIYGYPESEAIGCDLFTLLTSEYFTADGTQLELDDVLTTVSETGRWEGELHERHAAGTPLVVLTSVSAAGAGGGLVLVNRDVTAQRQEEHLATHDALTGLPNRRMLNNRLHEAFARACRTGGTMAVLFVDLDGFKPVNDRYGHAAGDAVLIATAQRILAAVRRTDSVGRLGGDEFLVILEDAGTDENISTVADRVVEFISAPIDVGGRSVSVRPSIGVAVAHRPSVDDHRPDQLLAAADRAMYEAKAQGGGPVFDPSR